MAANQHDLKVLGWARHTRSRLARFERDAFGHPKRHRRAPARGDDPWQLLQLANSDLSRTAMLKRLITALKRVRAPVNAALVLALAELARICEPDGAQRIDRCDDLPALIRSPQRVVLSSAPAHAPTAVPAPTHLAGAAA